MWKWSWPTITEYGVPSLALNYPCKEYLIIYESVHSYFCTCMRNKYRCKSEFVWNVHIQVMLKVISFSILNMHDLVETNGCHSQMYTSLTKCELTLCPAINGFQIPVKILCTWHRWPTPYFYLEWFWGSKCIENFNQNLCSVRTLFTNVTLPHMSHIIGVINCSL